MIKIKLTMSIYVYSNRKMLKANDLIASVKKSVELIVMNETNITKYLDLYNYSSDLYLTMDEYILDNYNYELFGKNKKWAELETIGHKEIQHFIPNIVLISYNYNNYNEVLKWIIKEDYYKLISFYALSVSYKIIRNNIAAIKMIWFTNDKTGLEN
jgi:hypothetical protein